MTKDSFGERVVGRLEGAADALEKNRTPDDLAKIRQAKAHNQKLMREMQTDLAALGVVMTISEDTNDD